MPATGAKVYGFRSGFRRSNHARKGWMYEGDDQNQTGRGIHRGFRHGGVGGGARPGPTGACRPAHDRGHRRACAGGGARPAAQHRAVSRDGQHPRASARPGLGLRDPDRDERAGGPDDPAPRPACPARQTAGCGDSRSPDPLQRSQEADPAGEQPRHDPVARGQPAGRGRLPPRGGRGRPRTVARGPVRRSGNPQARASRA